MDGNGHVRDDEIPKNSSDTESTSNNLPGRVIRIKTTTFSREKHGENTKYSVCRKVEEYSDIEVIADTDQPKSNNLWTLFWGVIASLIASAIWWMLGQWGLF